jgi:hypothetical protein
MYHPSHDMDFSMAIPSPQCRACGVWASDELILSPCEKCSNGAKAPTPTEESKALFDRVRFHREAAAVERCHVKPHLLRYSVGHHTNAVSSLVIQAWMMAHDMSLPRAELLVAVHNHDEPELISGDIPSVVKDLIGPMVEQIETSAARFLGLHVELTEEEALYLAAADRFEIWLWRFDEAAMGNSTALAWCTGYEQKWRDNPLPWPFMDLMEEVLAHKGLPKLSWPELSTIGGLS